MCDIFVRVERGQRNRFSLAPESVATVAGRLLLVGVDGVMVMVSVI